MSTTMSANTSHRSLLRAACSHDIGTGHLRRSLTLARTLQQRNVDVEILTDDDPVAHLLADGVDDVPVRFVPPASLIGAVDEDPATVIIDLPSGGREPAEQRELQRQVIELDRQGTAVVSLGHAVADSSHLRAVIDLYPSARLHAVNYFEGPEFLILRPAFRATERSSQDVRDQLLVAMGGTDPFDLTGLALRALAEAEYAGQVRVVLGGGTRHEPPQLASAAEELGLDITVDVELAQGDFAELMATSRAGIVAFGTTAYELMALGVPVLGFTHYEWQRDSAEFFESLGAIRHLGCAQQSLDEHKTALALASALADDGALNEMSDRGAAIVDGRGAERVADLVVEFSRESGTRRLDHLYVLAHPGDEVLGCGGTIIKQVQAGAHVGLAILGEGSESRHKGTEHPTVVRDRRKQLTSSLQQTSERLGISALYYFRFEDNRFDSHDLLDLVQTVEVLIERHEPRTVYTHHPGDLNIDHRRTFEAVATAVRPQATSPVRTLLSVEVPSSSEWGTVLQGPPFQPNWFEDVEDVLEEKLDVAGLYKSEIRDDPHPRSIAGLRSRAEHWGRLSGVSAAEGFVLHRNVVDGEAR